MNYFQMKNIPNVWLKYGFIERKVHPTAHSIRNRNLGDGNNLMNWVIEGSNTDQENDWTLLDTRQNNKGQGKSLEPH